MNVITELISDRLMKTKLRRCAESKFVKNQLRGLRGRKVRIGEVRSVVNVFRVQEGPRGHGLKARKFKES